MMTRGGPLQGRILGRGRVLIRANIGPHALTIAPNKQEENPEAENPVGEQSGGIFSKLSTAFNKVGEIGGIGKNYTARKLSKTIEKLRSIGSSETLVVPPGFVSREVLSKQCSIIDAECKFLLFFFLLFLITDFYSNIFFK
jgi:hypothetical protein